MYFRPQKKFFLHTWIPRAGCSKDPLDGYDNDLQMTACPARAAEDPELPRVMTGSESYSGPGLRDQVPRICSGLPGSCAVDSKKFDHGCRILHARACCWRTVMLQLSGVSCV